MTTPVEKRNHAKFYEFHGEVGHNTDECIIQPLVLKIGDEEHPLSLECFAVVVRSSSLYNGIIRRPGVRKLQAVLSTSHGMLKLSVEGGVITLKSSRLVPLECTMVSGPEGNLSATTQTVEERIKVAINP
ncbi:hypothetical protein Tco_0262255 [Tanacetum coccineum]